MDDLLPGRFFDIKMMQSCRIVSMSEVRRVSDLSATCDREKPKNLKKNAAKLLAATDAAITQLHKRSADTTTPLCQY